MDMKDSGDRTEYETGSQRDRRVGKGRFDLLSPIAWLKKAQWGEGGSLKYAPRNWERGQPLAAGFLCSAIRHLLKELCRLDDEPHDVAAGWNIDAYIHTKHQIEKGALPEDLDDRPEWDVDPEDWKAPEWLQKMADEYCGDSGSGGTMDQEDPSAVSAAHEAQKMKNGGFYLEENVNVRGMTSGPVQEFTISLVGVEACLCGGVPKLLSNPGAGEEVWWLACRECGATCATFKTKNMFEDTETMVASLEEMTEALTDLWNQYVRERREGDDK